MAQTEPVLQSMDILVAEDDQVSSFAMRSFLERDGHRVVCVVDGKQALEALQLHDFHCIFTDIAMPQMDGVELAQRIRTNFAQEFPPSAAVTEQIRNIFPQSPGQRRPIRRDIPIVAVTAHTMIGDKEKLLAQGINHYLAKPIIHEDLRAILKKLSSE
jgi:CheY-like chemotaxis protein